MRQTRGQVSHIGTITTTPSDVVPSPQVPLLVLTAPDMQPTLRQWQVSSDLPKATSVGLDSSWSITILKEYPPAFNAGLAVGFLQAIGQCSSDDTLTVPQAFADRCDSMLCTEYGAHIGPDFAGGTGRNGP